MCTQHLHAHTCTGSGVLPPSTGRRVGLESLNFPNTRERSQFHSGLRCPRSPLPRAEPFLPHVPAANLPRDDTRGERHREAADLPRSEKGPYTWGRPLGVPEASGGLLGGLCSWQRWFHLRNWYLRPLLRLQPGHEALTQPVSQRLSTLCPRPPCSLGPLHPVRPLLTQGFPAVSCEPSLGDRPPHHHF